MARRPLSEPNVSLEVLTDGCGGLNIDGCRIEHDGSGVWGNHGQDPSKHEVSPGGQEGTLGGGWHEAGSRRHPLGRWPANLVLGHSGSLSRFFKYCETGEQLEPHGDDSPSGS